jgi:hypothetical protein
MVMLRYFVIEVATLARVPLETIADDQLNLPN